MASARLRALRVGAACEEGDADEEERLGLLSGSGGLAASRAATLSRDGGAPSAAAPWPLNAALRALEAWRRPVTPTTRAPEWLKERIVHTEHEEETLAQLRHLASVPYDVEEPTHERELRRFFAAVRSPQEARGLAAGKDPRWKELGFQAEDPRTDFRGGGFLALQNLVYLAEAFPEDTATMLRESSSPSAAQGGSRSEGAGRCECLFAAACINISAILVLMLGLNTTPSMSPVRSLPCPAHMLARKNFAGLLVRSLPPPGEQDMEATVGGAAHGSLSAREVFGELFSAGVMKLHAEWRSLCDRKPDATLLDFGDALGSTAAALERLLGGLQVDAAGAPVGRCRGARVAFAAIDHIDARSRRTVVKNQLARAHAALLEAACRVCAAFAEALEELGLLRLWADSSKDKL